MAIQGAKYAAEAIDRRIEGKPPQKPFKYFDKGSMATISRFRAVALIGKFRLTGFIAWLMWLVVHLFYVTGFKNQFTAVMHWAVSFLGRGRSERTATEQQIFGRLAMAQLERGAQDLVSPPELEDLLDASRVYESRRAELEAIALEEARLTDAGERGRAESTTSASAYSKKRGAGPWCSSSCSRAHLGRMNSPSASTVTPSGPTSSPRAQVL